MAKADSSEMAILPMAMISALASEIPIIGSAGATVAPASVLPPNRAKL